MPTDTLQIAFEAIDKGLEKQIGLIDADLTKLEKQIDSTNRSAGNFGLSAQQIGSKMASAGKALTIGLTVPIAGLAVAATKAASDLNETSNKIQTLFGNATGAVMKFSDTASTSLGQSKKQALDAAADFAVFGKAAGLAGDDLVKFSKESVTLAADMASFFNTSPEEAITAIGAAFRGESEPIRRYGVLLDDASLKQQALKMGLIKTTTEALQPQARVLAAQALILQQTSAAQGDFAKTSGGLANQSRILNAQFQDMIAALGQSLLPIAVKVTGAANDLLTAFNNLDQSQKDLIVGFGLMAAAAGPVLTIGGKLVTSFNALKPILIDVSGGMLTMGKSVVDVAGTLSRIGVNANTVKDALIRLRASGALLTAELGVIAIGLIAIGKYLEEVGNAAKASSEDLIAMSRSGDLFKQAAATTEIMANGQDRLKAALDGTHEKIKAGTKEYADYKSAIDATAKAAGYEINAQGDLIQVFYGVGGRMERVIEAHYRLSKAQYDAVPGANQLVVVWNKLVDVGKQFADSIAPQASGVIIPLAKSYDVLGEAINRAKTRAVLANPVYADGAKSLEKLKIAIAGDIKKETDKFGESQKNLQERLKETADELKNLQREQGSVDKSTTKNAMSSAQLAAAQANLAAAQARLAKETDPIKQQQLAASIAVQQEKIAGANQAVVTYVDNSKRIAELKGQYDELNTEIAANAAAHEEATRRILFGYAEQQLAIGGLTQQEADALNKLAVQWGLKSQADVNAFRAVDEALSAFAKNADIDAFANKLDRISDKALGIKITPQIDYKNLREIKTEKALAVTVTPKLDPKKVKTDATELLNSKEMKKLGEPVIIPVKADTSTATVNMRYFNDYGLSPAIVYYDALIQRAGLFNTTVGQTPTLPTIPGYTPPASPTTPIRPPGSGEPEFASGGNFVVPSGYPNDSFSMRVSSGERVQVTPAGRGGSMPPININQTFNGAQGDPEQYKKIMYEVISDVFENVNAARK